MHEEFEKYKIEKNKITTVEGYVFEGDKFKAVYKNRYYIGFGDLINDFIDHKCKPWWVREPNHEEITEKYMELLNLLRVTWEP